MPSLTLPPKDFVASAEALAWRATPAEAEGYTRWLATSHYENFHLVSFLLPKRLHQDFYNVYAFCRWADDLGDEFDDTAESVRLLAWWRTLLSRMAGGEAEHPVFVALKETVHRHELPLEPFTNLILAFEQDQRVARYGDEAELLDYCRYSANPVGQLVLMLCGYRDAERLRLSDATCSGLQLANFWQDVSVDVQKGRVYLPQSLLERHGASVAQVIAGEETPAFLAAMREAVAWARQLLRQGQPLSRLVDRRLALDLELFNRGGQRILDKVEEQGYRVLLRRPIISKSERAVLLVRTLLWLPLR